MLLLGMEVDEVERFVRALWAKVRKVRLRMPRAVLDFRRLISLSVAFSPDERHTAHPLVATVTLVLVEPERHVHFICVDRSFPSAHAACKGRRRSMDISARSDDWKEWRGHGGGEGRRVPIEQSANGFD